MVSLWYEYVCVRSDLHCMQNADHIQGTHKGRDAHLEKQLL